MSQIDLPAVRRFLAQKEAVRQERIDRLFTRATADAQAIIEAIAREFAVTRIWQWGSLLDRSRFSEISDIDVAVEGVGSPREFFAILRTAGNLTDLPVDVIELENVPAEVADRIRRKGVVAYERADR